jgi:TetR/AcrR family transcriptional repressor of nem operon
VSYRPEHKLQTRSKILDAAETLFKTQGYDATGIDAVMQNAGLTRGGFYAHFSDKLDLFTQIILPRKIDIPSTDNIGSQKALLRNIFDFYLSTGHRDNPGDGCPLPALSVDISKIGGKARNRYKRIFNGFVKIIANCLSDSSVIKNEDTAKAILTLMIGGVIVARALGTGKASDQALVSCRLSCERLAKFT